MASSRASARLMFWRVAMLWRCLCAATVTRGRFLQRASVRAGRPAPAARLRGVPRVVRSAVLSWGWPFGAGFGDFMALSVVAGPC